jgi:hypothetical protein
VYALILRELGLVADALSRGEGRPLADCPDSLVDRSGPVGNAATPWAHSAGDLSTVKEGGQA